MTYLKTCVALCVVSLLLCVAAFELPWLKVTVTKGFTQNLLDIYISENQLCIKTFTPTNKDLSTVTGDIIFDIEEADYCVNVKTACELAAKCVDEFCTPEETKSYTLDVPYALSVSSSVLCSLEAEQVDVAFYVHATFTAFISLATLVAGLKFVLRLKAFGDMTIVVLSMCASGLGFISLIYFIWYGNGKGGFVSDVHSSSTQLVEYSFGPGFFMGLFSWFFMGTLATGSPILLFMPIIKEETGDDDHEHDD